MSVLLQTSIDVRATRSQVWAVLTDFAAYGEWSSFSSIDGDLRQGARIHIRMPGMSFRPTLTVVRADEELEWAAKILSPRVFHGRHHFALSNTTPGTTHVVNTEEFTGATVLPFRPFFARGSGRDSGYTAFNLALKARAERGDGRA